MGPQFLRSAAWLTAARVKAYLWILATLNIVTLAFLLATSRGGVDRHGFLLGTDFLSFWTAGRLLVRHADVYDQAAHIAEQQAYFSQVDAFTAFFYPPPFLPFCWPLGALAYFPALILWLVSTGALFVFAVTRWLHRYRLPAPTWLLLLAYPACVIQITHGQTAFLVAGLLLLGALWVQERPMLAGVAFGLATIKPQFGVLVPMVLLLTGEWRVIVAASAAALALSATSTMLFGPGVWNEWYALTRAAQAAMDAGSMGYAKMVSPFAGAMLLGIPLWFSYIIQAAVSIGVAVALAIVSWRRPYSSELGALMLVGSVQFTPFVLDYDLLLLGPALIVMVARSFGPWEKLAVFLAFAAPAFARPIAMNLHLPIAPVIALLLFYLLWRRVREHPASSTFERQNHA